MPPQSPLENFTSALKAKPMHPSTFPHCEIPRCLVSPGLSSSSSSPDLFREGGWPSCPILSNISFLPCFIPSFHPTSLPALHSSANALRSLLPSFRYTSPRAFIPLRGNLFCMFPLPGPSLLSPPLSTSSITPHGAFLAHYLLLLLLHSLFQARHFGCQLLHLHRNLPPPSPINV